MVRLEQRNDTFLEMGIFDDGPFEAGDEINKNPNLVPVPSNSYMGNILNLNLSLKVNFFITSQKTCFAT